MCLQFLVVATSGILGICGISFHSGAEYIEIYGVSPVFVSCACNSWCLRRPESSVFAAFPSHSGAEYIQIYGGSSLWSPFCGSASWDCAAPSPKLINARGPAMWERDTSFALGGSGQGGWGVVPSLNFVGKTSFALFLVFPCLRISFAIDFHKHI